MKTLIRVVIAVAILASARAATAADHDVSVLVAGDAREANALERVVRDLLVRLGANVEVSRVDAVDSSVVLGKPASFTPMLARVWIDLRADDHAMIYLVDATWDRVLVRRVARDPAHIEVCREEIGHILETAIEAMLAGGKIGVERVVLAPPPSPPVLPRAVRPPARRASSHEAPSSSAPVFHAGVTSETGVFADGNPTEALGLWAALEAPRDASLAAGGWLTLVYRFPLRRDALAVGVELQGLETRLVGRLDSRIASRVRLELGAGVGVDVMDVAPIATRAGASLAPRSGDTTFVVRVIAGVRLWNVLGVLLSTDIDVTRHDFTFTENGSRVVALSPYAARPALVLEASFF